MDNIRSIQSFKKHVTDLSQMKWENYAKEYKQKKMGVIKFEDIPKNRLNQICHTSVACEVRPVKKDPNCTLITIFGTNL